MDRSNAHKPVTVFFIVGEKSGDMLGKSIITQFPSSFISRGMGGEEMAEAGMQLDFSYKALNVMGFLDVCTAFFRILRFFRKVKKKILKIDPEVVCCIDSPSFSLPLAKSLRKAGYKGKIIQYVAPTAWAWKKNRTKRLQRDFDHLFVLFPFEKPFFANHGIPTTFVGHPKAPTAPIQTNPLGQQKVVLFPGSREKEITRNLPLQLRAFLSLQNKYPFLEGVISAASFSAKATIEKIAADTLPISEAKPKELLKNATFCIATSGTICLEIAFMQIPSIVVYKMAKLDYLLAKYFFRIDLPFYCIVNILLNKELYPEWYHTTISPKAFADAVRVTYEKRIEQLPELAKLHTLFSPDQHGDSLVTNYILQSVKILK